MQVSKNSLLIEETFTTDHLSLDTVLGTKITTPMTRLRLFLRVGSVEITVCESLIPLSGLTSIIAHWGCARGDLTSEAANGECPWWYS